MKDIPCQGRERSVEAHVAISKASRMTSKGNKGMIKVEESSLAIIEQSLFPFGDVKKDGVNQGA